MGMRRERGGALQDPYPQPSLGQADVPTSYRDSPSAVRGRDNCLATCVQGTVGFRWVRAAGQPEGWGHAAGFNRRSGEGFFA